MKKHIPNTITCFNLVSGIFAIIFAMQWNYMAAACFIALAAVFDFFDGLAARLLHTQSTIGKDLDSLSDVVSFGVAPGMIVYNFLIEYVPMVVSANLYTTMLVYIAFLIPVLSAVRLARFNNDHRQTENFIGLPTPANALFFAFYISSIVMMDVDMKWQVYLVSGLTLVFSLLLNANLPMFSLKIKNLRWQDNKIRYIFIGISILIIVILWNMMAIPLIISLYILMSILNLWFDF